ncbi:MULTISPECIES: cobalt ABC transporter permease [Thalassospira]|uniref:Cobalt ABC transporter permease n=2 Tax=Thalassospira TaxID=168934 RepID=A0A367W5A1_9PROT|nr:MULTISPECIES: cobalt ABC transporter permease [Thalassospira]MDG4720958.1 cobalt ABC transporter permease [Thalassospira sp. FZY0004]RCK36616.1 cobalt ABC transporter permease [Thalassospira profundimaris]
MAKLATAFLLAGLVVSSGAAHAHKVIASVFPSGSNVEGEIGFSNGDMAADTLVEVFGPAGNKIDEVKTDSDGFFVYTPSQKVDLLFRADLGAGHIAEARFAIADLSDIADIAVQSGVTGNAQQKTEANSDPAKGNRSEITAEQEAVIAAIIRDELRPLRREITAYKEKNDLQSILGGIGYIFGFFGIAYYLAARRLRAKATKP